MVLINVEKHEHPFLLKHPTDLYLLAVQNSRLGFYHENYIKFMEEFDRKKIYRIKVSCALESLYRWLYQNAVVGLTMLHE